MKRAALLCLALTATTALADEVLLRGGGKITGTIVQRSESAVVVEVGPGWVTVPMSRVERIQEGRSLLAQYRERAGGLASDDAGGWLELALWARDAGLPTRAREAFEKVLALDPGNVVAHQALGHVALDDRWVSADEAYRARGFVPFEGTWVTPSERESLLRERAEAATAERLRLEGEARVREAEARAREAEARARAAEAEARRAEAGLRASAGAVGIPFFAFPGTVVVTPRPFCRPSPHPRPSRPATPPPTAPRFSPGDPARRLPSDPQARN